MRWLIKYLNHQNNYFIIFCIYKVVYTNACVHFFKIRKTGKIWASIKDSGEGLGVKNIPDLVLKEIYRIYEKRELTKKEIKNYEKTEREIYENLII